MKERFAGKVDLKIFAGDSEEAKPYNLKSAPSVLVDKELISISVATDEDAMAELLRGKM